VCVSGLVPWTLTCPAPSALARGSTRARAPWSARAAGQLAPSGAAIRAPASGLAAIRPGAVVLAPVVSSRDPHELAARARRDPHELAARARRDPHELAALARAGARYRREPGHGRQRRSAGIASR
jgi:hypothetical protein